MLDPIYSLRRIKVNLNLRSLQQSIDINALDIDNLNSYLVRLQRRLNWLQFVLFIVVMLIIGFATISIICHICPSNM
jgi:hypothetical protein